MMNDDGTVYLDEATTTALASARGRTIAEAAIVRDDDMLLLVFSDGSKLRVWDSGQNCCEYRHMTCDDDLSSFSGAVVVAIAVAPGPDINDGEAHETMFVRVDTNAGTIVLTSHNEHNGYYGGFSVVATLQEKEA